MINKYFKIILFIFAIIFTDHILAQKSNISISYDDFPRFIKISTPTKSQRKIFNRDIDGKYLTIYKDSIKIKGYVTDNKKFYQEIMLPTLNQYKSTLKKLHPVDAINYITLFGHEIYRIYFTPEFYRWAGDLFDLDDPQEEIYRFNKKYGLDCSGFAAMPYEISTDLNIIDPKSDEAVFSSIGYKYYCIKNNKKDTGGRNKTSNNYRLDTHELDVLGREVFRLEKGSIPTSEQLKLLQAGDLVGRNGHFGIIVMINNEPYYLESGGYVVPKNNGLPCKAKESLAIFAKDGYLTVRRSLPDKNQ